MTLRQAGMVRHLRQAEWLTRRRARAYCRILAVVPAAVSAAWIGMALLHGGIDFSGHPIAPDFAPYWTAAKLALSDTPGAAYDPATHYARERELFGGASLGGPTPFVYPPLFLLVCLPFAMLPYAAALAAWLGLTAAGYWRSVRAIWPRTGLALPVLVYPGLLVNLLNGQNGLLSAALFAVAALQLDRRPMVAGACFGCLA
jgi:alpha-1,2-mannosyltransferase